MNPQDAKQCYNCHAPLGAKDQFCPACGQKYTTGRVTLWELFSDFFREQLNLDSRLFKTVGALFVPGKLTEEFFKGKHKTYFPPIRFFLIIAVLLFALITIKIGDTEDKGINIGINTEDISHANERRRMIYEIDTLVMEAKAQGTHPSTNTILDTLSKKVHDLGGAMKDSIVLGEDFIINSDTDTFRMAISLDDLEKLSSRELGEKYCGDLEWWKKILFVQGAKVVKKGGNLIEYMLGKSAIALFLMMPFLAAFLKLIYIRRNIYFVEHLVFSFHYHTLLFILLIVGFLLNPYIGRLFIFILVLAFVYLFMAMKRIYGQGWLKTFIKIGIVSIFYTLLITVFLVLTLAVSFLFF